MAKIEVTISQIENTASKVQRMAQEFLTVAGKVLTSAENVSRTWEGDSQVAFITEQRAANDWYKRMMELVNTYVDNLRNAAKTYEKTDSDAAAAIKKC